MTALPDFVARFWSKVEITPTCWLWTGGVSGDGYGRVRVGRGRAGYMAPAHQVAYELVTGEQFPGGCDGHHECAVRRCIRPHAEHVVPREPEEHRGYIWKERRRRQRQRTG